MGAALLYNSGMKSHDTVLGSVRDWLSAVGGLVTQEQIERLESRIDEIDALLDALEERLHPRGG